MTARVLLAAAVLALLAALFVFKLSSAMPDFEVYWRAGDRAAAAAPLYREDDEHYQLKYLPAFAVLAVPVSLLPLPAAKALWFAASVWLLYALLASSLALLPARRKGAAALMALTFVAMGKFYGHELVLGQVNLLFAGIVLAAVRAAVRGNSPAAGLLVALAVVIKPYAVIFAGWIAARRDRAALGALAGGLAAALILPAALYGLRGSAALHADWWRTVTASTAPNLLNPDNVSLAAMYAKWLGPGATAASLAVATAAALLGAAAVVFAARGRVPAPDGLEAAMLLTLIPLLSPQGWDYVFLIATPAVMFVVNYERSLPALLRAASLAALGIVAFSLYDVLGRRLYAAFMMLSVISVCYLVVVAALLALRLRRAA